MELIYAIPADAAQTSPDGKFSLLGGGIENIYAPAFPAVHPGLALVVRLRVLASEANQKHKFSIEITGPKDFHVSSGDVAEFKPAPFHSASDGSFTVNLAITMALLVFPEPGTYDFHLSVDSQEVGVLPLSTRKVNNDEASSS